MLVGKYQQLKFSNHTVKQNCKSQIALLKIARKSVMTVDRFDRLKEIYVEPQEYFSLKLNGFTAI